MSNFENNPFGLSDYFAIQDAHYIGDKAIGMRDTLRPSATSSSPPPLPPKDKKYNTNAAAAAAAAAGRSSSARSSKEKVNQHSTFPAVPGRKPIVSTDQRTAQQATEAIRRKPVGHQRPAPVKTSTTKSAPTISHQASASSSNSSVPRIYRDANGRFDSSTIRGGWSSTRPTPPASPSRPRPGSRGSSKSSFNKADRTDTKGSSRPGSRRGSLSSLFAAAGRRLSDAFKDKSQIVKMSSAERRDYIGSRKDQHPEKPSSSWSDEREGKRRANPDTRPQYQRDAIVRKNLANMELASGASGNVDAFEAMRIQSELNAKANAAQRREHEAACRRADAQGKPHPKRPADLPVADLTLTPAERNDARLYRDDTLIAEVRADDEGFDQAPQELMHVCKRCKRPVTTFIHSNGHCDRCHQWEQQQRSEYAEKHVQGEAESNVSPNSPYIKLPAAKKIRKLRRTLYEDPGNPFMDLEDASKLTTTSRSAHALQREAVDYAADALYDDELVRSSTSSSRTRLLNGDPFEDAVESPGDHAEEFAATFVPLPLEERGPCGRGAALTGQVHRRSFAAALESEAPALESPEKYIAPRSQWDRGKKQALGNDSGHNNNLAQDRNTRFYGFYDDLLEAYQSQSM
ncbi:hypothetical protein KC332_g5334 [Hortaea werneckii]|nr:hypothetical protein KC358_g17117 [Hortaea werneckii]KAI6845519.1 hypothetical protein KC350_g4394 [Hortaea werneckii]KAI6927647.1 hypothetical protein KC348_g8342 [Hortaea werneckii]KAI6934292.1 hypothetical protein KC341_g7696 [Hortaea werneckii]KAI6973763.1 hypothetical protein KC321_g5482 [Hortaea werneckii]